MNKKQQIIMEKIKFKKMNKKIRIKIGFEKKSIK